MDEFDIRGEANVQRTGVTIGKKFDDGVIRQVPIGVKMNNLLIGGRHVPIDAFERIPEEPLGGEPLGHVNWWFGKHAGLSYQAGWRQLVWCNQDGEVRRTIVGKEPPEGLDPNVWKESYQKFAELPQLYIGD